MDPFENPGQQKIASALGVMKLPAGRSIVAEVGKSARVNVQDVWPVGFCTGGVQHGQPDRVSCHTSIRAKPALIANRQQPGERIVARVPRCTTAVDTLKEQVSIHQIVEAHSSNRIHQGHLS